MMSMIRVIRHRGPDGEGLLFDGPAMAAPVTVATNETPAAVLAQRLPYTPSKESGSPRHGCTLGLGHRRLSIVDLTAAGHQPMCDAEERVWITFNGEVYNHLELREELEVLGHRFNSHTDTEVILAAFLEWGDGCLPRFNGMFAFVIFDCRTHRLFAARDRFGVKPLYYWQTPTGGLAIASEIKQFTEHPVWRAIINPQMAYDFVVWGISDHTEETLFKDVFQLQGGHYLTIDMSRSSADSTTPSIRRWYQPSPARFDGTFAEAGARFRELLTDSVRLRLRADVRVGSCLSGGMDSSSIVCVMRNLLGSDAAGMQHTFSACSDVARFDERRHIEEVVRHTGATPHYVTPDPDVLLSMVDRLTWHQDEPFGSTSIFAQWCVFAMARQAGVLVMLDGQGADEVLAGYHGFFHTRLAGLLLSGRLPRLLREGNELNQNPGHSWINHGRGIANVVLPHAISDWLRRVVGRTTTAPAYLDLGVLEATSRMPPGSGPFLRSPVASQCITQLVSTSVPMLLHWEDRDSMAHGVEARVPFLDYRLAEFCLGLPEEYKLQGAWTKRVLREGMADLLPESIRLRRDKLGFATAEEVWMRQTHRVAFEALLRAAIPRSRGILTPALMEYANRMLSGETRFNFSLWRCISLAAWMEQFSVSPSPT